MFVTSWVESAVHSLLVFAGANQWLVALFVAVAAFSEAIVVVGALFPGTTVILAIAAAMGSANMPVWPLVVAGFIGAAASDGLSYWIGYRHRDDLGSMWPFSRRPDLIEKGQRFFDRYGARSVFIARFLPGVRAIVPVSAGMSGLKPAEFCAANLTSAAVWAISHIGGSAFLGDALHQSHMHVAHAWQIALGAAVLIVLTGLVLRRARAHPPATTD